MSNLLEKIFECVILEDSVNTRASIRINEEVKRLTASYAESMDEEQLEALRNVIHCASLTAEQVGFELGVKFLARLVQELLFDF